ncbi:conserved hypothetical protein [Methylocella tundrae]|uniref:Uncharacterized protein n=1 Tax=Methylocella tundrae TaxID=227605 RepID=A0A8B6MD56_METTU|nr:hypothetical protein [Methylocella tundrae]VTZ27237.1 conserved hypothetical protein [Methylocella tundrae]VTZ52176.1 conserved hypothetical protein [Methylocella tundrae]
MADDKDELFQKATQAGPAPDGDAGDTSSLTASGETATTPIPQPEAASSGDSLGEARPEPETIAPGQPKVAPRIEKVKQPSRAPVLAAALILGALAGFGGAFALRMLDQQQAPDDGDHVAELNAHIVELEHKSEASAAALAAIGSRLTAAENSAGKAAASADSALNELHAELAAQPKAAGESPGAEAPDIAPIEAKIAAFEQKVSALETKLAAPKVDIRAQQQDREAAVQSARALAAVPAKGVAAISLLQLVTRGEPFAGELAVLDSLGEDPAKLAPLRAAAKTGVASVGDLADRFAALAPTLDAPAQKHDSGILDRLAHDAANLVHIHRQGDPNDPDLPGRVAAIEKALARLDVAKAYAIWSQLPAEVKVKSAAWGEAAKARLDAVAAASAIEADAVTALGKPKS